MATKAGKRPLRSLTATEKLEAIRRVHDGESKASVARDIGVPESTLRGWCKNEDKISYLSRQSSPETDESLEQSTPPNKRVKFEEPAMQPFNLSLKSSGGTYSPNSNEYRKNNSERPNSSLNLSTKIKPPNQTADDHESNRAELARMSVELGLDRPELFFSNISNSSNLAANLGMLAVHWNYLFQQQQQQQKTQLQANRSKITAPADTSTHMTSAGLLTTVDQDKLLPKERQSVNDSVQYWLASQQTMMSFHHQNSLLSNVQNGSGNSASATTPTTSSSSKAGAAMVHTLNGVNPDHTKVWNWSPDKGFHHSTQGYPQIREPPAGNKHILYHQLTKDSPFKNATDSDPQNAENLSMNDKEKCFNINSIAHTNGNSKGRSALDSLLLFNNNSNVTVNKKDGKDSEANISQSEAVVHGEKFLRWLEAYSDPSVTAMQIMQFRNLLNNVKTGVDRRNGDLQNKAKVKRK